MFLLAAEYEYPGVVPDCLPKRPFKFGPGFLKRNRKKVLKTWKDEMTRYKMKFEDAISKMYHNVLAKQDDKESSRRITTRSNRVRNQIK